MCSLESGLRRERSGRGAAAGKADLPGSPGAAHGPRVHRANGDRRRAEWTAPLGDLRLQPGFHRVSGLRINMYYTHKLSNTFYAGGLGLVEEAASDSEQSCPISSVLEGPASSSIIP